MSPVSDEALVRRARLGDEAAFDAIVDRYGPGMHRYATRLLQGSVHDAADATQDALISAWRSLPDFAGRSSLRTWLFRLVDRRAVDLQRRRRPVPVEDDVLVDLAGPADEDPQRAAIDSELLRALQHALDALTRQQRATWLLREIEGLSYAEIGETLAMPVGSVRGHLHRGRRLLAERMAPWR